MAEKVLRTKIALLYKTYAQWDAIKDTYIPLKGEVCLCEVPAESGVVVSEPALLLKAGDGVKSFAELPWLSGLAADVFAWAKKENLEWSDMTDDFKQGILDLIGGEETNTLYQIVDDGSGVWKLQKSEDKGSTWVDAVGRIDINDLLAKKPNIIEEGTNGTARLFNEKDGGGAKFEHKDGSEAFVGVNDGGKDGMMAQIYADIKENGAWVGSRINVFHDGIYYVSKAAQKAGAAKDEADREIATIGDIKALGKVLRFRGVFNSLDEVTNPEHGDVAIVGNKEYIYVVNGGLAEWKEFGDVSQYATKAELEAEIARAQAAEAEIYEYVDASINDTMNFIIQERDAERAARIAGDELLQDKIDAEEARAKAEEAKKVDKELTSAQGKAIIFNEADGGGAKFEHTDGTESFVGVNNGGADGIAAQIYADKLVDGKWQGAKIDVTNGGVYYTVGNKSAAERDIPENEIATKGDIAGAVEELADIAHTGNVNDLIQTAGDILILNCND